MTKIALRLFHRCADWNLSSPKASEIDHDLAVSYSAVFGQNTISSAKYCICPIWGLEGIRGRWEFSTIFSNFHKNSSNVWERLNFELKRLSRGFGLPRCDQPVARKKIINSSVLQSHEKTSARFLRRSSYLQCRRFDSCYLGGHLSKQLICERKIKLNWKFAYFKQRRRSLKSSNANLSKELPYQAENHPQKVNEKVKKEFNPLIKWAISWSLYFR